MRVASRESNDESEKRTATYKKCNKKKVARTATRINAMAKKRK